MVKAEKHVEEKPIEAERPWKVFPAEYVATRARQGSPDYDDMFNDALKQLETMNSVGLSYKDKDYKKLWIPLNTRIKKHKAKADRKFNVELHTAKGNIFLVKKPL